MQLLVIDHSDSLESIERDGQIVKVVGKGLMKSPGHPAGNQQYSSQLEFLKKLTENPGMISVFNRDQDNHTEYLGKYRLLSWRIRESWAGFRYFEYKLFRVLRSVPGEELEFPLESDPN